MQKAIEERAPSQDGAVRSVDNPVRDLAAADAATIEARDMGAGVTRKARANEIIRRTALRHRCSVDEILGKSRRAPLVTARYEAIQIVARVFDMSSTQLGELFNRDHTSILWALGRVAQSKETKRGKAGS